DGEGDPRGVHDRAWPDDDDPRVHPGPEPPGRHAQRPTPGPRRRAEHRPDLDRCREGDRTRAAGADGQARRVRPADPRSDRVDDLLAEGVRGRPVLVRADLNVPLDGARITDDGRIRAVLPTLTALRDAGARVTVCSHLGRPKGAPDPKYSLAPVAARLAELLGSPLAFAGDTVDESAH